MVCPADVRGSCVFVYVKRTNSLVVNMGVKLYYVVLSIQVLAR